MTGTSVASTTTTALMHNQPTMQPTVKQARSKDDAKPCQARTQPPQLEMYPCRRTPPCAHVHAHEQANTPQSTLRHTGRATRGARQGIQYSQILTNGHMSMPGSKQSHSLNSGTAAASAAAEVRGVKNAVQLLHVCNCMSTAMQRNKHEGQTRLGHRVRRHKSRRTNTRHCQTVWVG